MSHILLDILHLVNNQKQIDGIVLSIVLHEVRHNGVNHSKELVVGLIVLQPDLIFLSDVTGKIADIFVTPFGEVFVGAFQKVVETASGIFLAKDHGEDR